MKNNILIAVICVVLTFILTQTFSSNEAKSAVEPNVYQRVLKTKKLRCGYAPWPSLIDVDPNTGELSGISYDYMNEVGNAMGIEIEWTMELGFGDIIEALNSKKVDAICSGVWTNAMRGQNALPVTPISYQGVNVYARAGDSRFDNNLEAINNPSVKIVVSDGESAETIAQTDFPKATTVQLPQMVSGAEMLVNVATGKADISFIDREVGSEFMKNNPGKLKEVPVEYPVRLFGNSTWVRQGEFEFLNALNVATFQLMNTGRIEQIIQRHEKVSGTFVRATKPFALAK